MRGGSRKASTPVRRIDALPDRPRVPIASIIESVATYERLVCALGLHLDRVALRKETARQLRYRGPTKTFFSEAHAAKHPTHTAPAAMQSAVDRLAADVLKLVRTRLNGALPKEASAADAKAIRSAVAQLSPEDRADLRERLLAGKHGGFVQRAEAPIQEFRQVLAQYAQGQTLARKALVQHIQKELAKRQIHMSFDTIEERFRSNTSVKTVPACLIDIIRGLDDRFRTGLVPIDDLCGDEDPKAWLEHRRPRYCFKSASAMHQAIADATGQRYDSVHKALGSKTPARRIQKDIVDCFNNWEERYQRNEDLGIAEEHRGVSVETVQAMLHRLRARYGTNGVLKKVIASELDVNPSWVQRYLAAKPRVKYMPMRYYAQIAKLADGPLKTSGESYLKDEQTRELASVICQRANKALAKAQESRRDPDQALDHYKKLRRRLIEVLKQRRTAPELAEVDPEEKA